MIKSKQTIFAVFFLALIFAFLGSFLSQYLFKAKSATANSAQKVIAAGELRLLDDSGRTKVLLTLVRGQPRLFMLDQDGEYRLEMGLGEKGEPHIWLRDQEGAAKVQVRLSDNGLPSFVLVDQKGQDRAVLGLGNLGDPALLMKDDKGQDRVAIWQTNKNNGLALTNEQGKPLGTLTCSADKGIKLNFFDISGRNYWEAP